MIYKKDIQEYLQESTSAFEKLENQSSEISVICEKVLALRAKNKILICGNGGLQLTQHIAAEFVVDLKLTMYLYLR